MPKSVSASSDAGSKAVAARERLAAAATLKPTSRARWFAFIGLAIIVQLNWGLFGVCTRYLQVHSDTAHGSIPSLQLCVVMTVVSWAGLVIFAFIPNCAKSALRALQRRRRAARSASQGNLSTVSGGDDTAQEDDQQQQQQPIAASASLVCGDHASSFVVAARPSGRVSARASGRVSGALASAIDLDARIAKALAASNAATDVARDVEAGGVPITTAAAAAAEAAADAKRAARRARLVSAAAATVIGTLVALQGLTLIYASRLTRAYIVQLVFLLTPLTTAVASRFFLRQPTPRALWPSLAAAIVGSALVVTGNWMSHGGAAGEPGSTSARDAAAGLALAFVSMLLLAAYLLMLQVTQHVVTGVQVMWGNSYVGVLLLTPLALAIEGLDWSWVLRLTPFDWGVLAFAAFFIDAVNTIWTQHCSRVLGAAIVSLFISCRLVSSVVGSIVLLHEVPTSPLTFAGFGVVGVALSGFMILQAWDKSKAAKAEAAEAEAEAAAAGGEPAAEAGADAKDSADRV